MDSNAGGRSVVELHEIGSCAFSLRYIYIELVQTTGGIAAAIHRNQRINSTLTEGHLLQPVFLGADILSLTRQTRNHWYRMHQKYGAAGLATKICGMDLIHRGRNLHVQKDGVWCYTVQGLFKLMFDMVEPETQKKIMMILKDCWMIHCTDMPLPDMLQCDTTTTTTKLHPLLVEKPNKPLEKLLTCLDTAGALLEHKEKTLYEQLYKTVQLYQTVALSHSLDLVSKLVMLQSELTDHISESEDQTNGEETLLNCVCSWLSVKFRSLFGRVQYQADCFKKTHIDAIGNLPPSENICKAIFPKCMLTLFTKWLDATHNDKLSTGENCSKHARLKVNVYPFVQLILEFSNNALVSGVSHVLYSRLLLESPT